MIRTRRPPKRSFKDVATLGPETRRFGVLSLLAMTLGVSHTGAAYANAAEALSERLGQMQSFSASFNQRVEAENGQILENSEGVLHLRRPDRFFWQTFEPFSIDCVHRRHFGLFV